jgi:hypothetical protein
VTDHRGAHPEDAKAFSEAALPAIRSAVADLAWLLARGYTDVAALKLVGDRYGLTQRQRAAVARCTCTDAQRESREARRVRVLDGQPVDVDAFNVLITLERALGGGPVLIGKDGAVRDLGGVHGTWRRVAETERAIEAAGLVLGDTPARWLVDAPISNSGRLAGMLRAYRPAWEVEVVPRPDPALAASDRIVCTSDAWILDQCRSWFGLTGAALPEGAWRVELG